MPKFSYVAMDAKGKETKGTLEVSNQNEAIARVKEMQLFPTKIVEVEKEKPAIKSAMQQMGQFHSQMRTLEEASTFDEAKVRALAAQQSQAMTEMIVQKARVKNELLQVLTADQKTKLAAFEAKHEQRMQHHMQSGQDPNSD